VTLAALHIRLLGGFDLIYRDAPVVGVNTARLQSLLAYLILHTGSPQSRQHVAFLLWPDSPESHAVTRRVRVKIALRMKKWKPKS